MFQFTFIGMQQAYEEIENQIIKRNALITEIQSIFKGLDSFSGMGDIKADLNKQIECLEIEQMQYIQMLQSLNLILDYYAECEKRVISKCELGEYKPIDISLRSNDFSSIAKELQDIQLD